MAGSLGALEQLDQVAAPVPHQLVAVTGEEQDDRRGVDGLAAALADRRLGIRVHAQLSALTSSPSSLLRSLV